MTKLATPKSLGLNWYPRNRFMIDWTTSPVIINDRTVFGQPFLFFLSVIHATEAFWLGNAYDHARKPNDSLGRTTGHAFDHPFFLFRREWYFSLTNFIVS